jgi:hypothetical protein
MRYFLVGLLLTLGTFAVGAELVVYVMNAMGRTIAKDPNILWFGSGALAAGILLAGWGDEIASGLAHFKPFLPWSKKDE